MIKVYAPASIGNINVGFDTMGVALSPVNGSLLGDSVIIQSNDYFTLSNYGNFFNELPSKVEDNIVYQSWKYFCDILGKKHPVSIRLEKNVPISSGLGSSASSIVATFTAMNNYCGNPFSKNQLLIFMADMEKKISGEIHFDNVAPSFLGGMQIILQENNIISQNIPCFRNWLWVIAYPGIKMSTAESRSVLPLQYSRKDCITHARYVSGFVHACHTNQELLAIKLMKDVIAEPYRASLIPNFFFIRDNIINIGALMCGISGSGPTLFGLCNQDNVAVDVAQWLTINYLKNKKGFVHICRSNLLGASCF